MNTFAKNYANLKDEVDRALGDKPGDAKGRDFHGMAVGDTLAWDDWFVEADYPNTYVEKRRLAGEIIHMHLGRWGFGLRMKLTQVPDGDSLKPGDVVFRWGDTITWGGKPCRCE